MNLIWWRKGCGWSWYWNEYLPSSHSWTPSSSSSGKEKSLPLILWIYSWLLLPIFGLEHLPALESSAPSLRGLRPFWISAQCLRFRVWRGCRIVRPCLRLSSLKARAWECIYGPCLRSLSSAIASVGWQDSCSSRTRHLSGIARVFLLKAALRARMAC